MSTMPSPMDNKTSHRTPLSEQEFEQKLYAWFAHCYQRVRQETYLDERSVNVLLKHFEETQVLLAAYRAQAQALEEARAGWVLEVDKGAAYLSELSRLRAKPTVIQVEAGYACSHCGTSLRTDSPDCEGLAQVEAERDALKARVAWLKRKPVDYHDYETWLAQEPPSIGGNDGLQIKQKHD